MPAKGFETDHEQGPTAVALKTVPWLMFITAEPDTFPRLTTPSTAYRDALFAAATATADFETTSASKSTDAFRAGINLVLWPPPARPVDGLVSSV
jgi:hypothetical protein